MNPIFVTSPQDERMHVEYHCGHNDYKRDVVQMYFLE